MLWRAGGPSTSAGSDVELRDVPQAGHVVTCVCAFGRGPTFIGAGVLEGVEVAIIVEQGEPLGVDFDPSGRTGREFVCFGDCQ